MYRPIKSGAPKKGNFGINYLETHRLLLTGNKNKFFEGKFVDEFQRNAFKSNYLYAIICNCVSV